MKIWSKYFKLDFFFRLQHGKNIKFRLGKKLILLNSKIQTTECLGWWDYSTVYVFFSDDCEWSSWSDCSKTCGVGTRTREIDVDAQKGGKACDKDDGTENCNLKECPSKQTISLTHFLYRILDGKKLAASNLAFQTFKRFIGT